MHFAFEVEREDDGRWIAEVAQLAGALAYGASAREAMSKAEALAVLALAGMDRGQCDRSGRTAADGLSTKRLDHSIVR